MLSFSKLRYAVSISIPNNLFLLIPNSQARLSAWYRNLSFSRWC